MERNTACNYSQAAHVLKRDAKNKISSKKSPRARRVVGYNMRGNAMMVAAGGRRVNNDCRELKTGTLAYTQNTKPRVAWILIKTSNMK